MASILITAFVLKFPWDSGENENAVSNGLTAARNRTARGRQVGQKRLRRQMGGRKKRNSNQPPRRYKWPVPVDRRHVIGDGTGFFATSQDAILNHFQRFCPDTHAGLHGFRTMRLVLLCHKMRDACKSRRFNLVGDEPEFGSAGGGE
ncbi:hypothetical protein [Rhodoblastus sp.]|uniref:hypothetical protein n=1 Tax=Rhodoblastus sp. TaxID=1962975 RepID=UPI0025E3F604|nr:hypothetical protein [Rhodoblastus sp.]